MLYVCASDLSASELARLGNNLRPGRRPDPAAARRRADRRHLDAVNRSLEGLRERVDVLYPPVPRLDPARRAS